MPKTKAGYKKIMGEIPINVYDSIKAYNAVSSKPLNVSRAIEQCLTAELKKIQEAKVASLFKRAENAPDKVGTNTGKIGLGASYSDEAYEQAITDIESGVSVPELYKKYVDAFYEDTGDKSGWLTVLTANRIEDDREKKKITFFFDDVRIFAVGSMTAHHERREHEKQ